MNEILTHPVTVVFILAAITAICTGLGALPFAFLKTISDGMVFHDFQPAHHGIVVDSEGHLWVRRPVPGRLAVSLGSFQARDEPASWDVFEPEGVWVGTVQTPAGLRIFEIGKGYLLGLRLDALDVEHVQLYGLHRE